MVFIHPALAQAGRLSPDGRTIWVKAEAFNPAASVKDRLAIGIDVVGAPVAEHAFVLRVDPDIAVGEDAIDLVAFAAGPLAIESGQRVAAQLDAGRGAALGALAVELGDLTPDTSRGKAARLVEMMETQGVVTPANAVGKREILVEER